MKDITLTIDIDKPMSEIYEYLLHPKNTPKWIDFIVEEETNEWPVKLGSIYRSRRNKRGGWTEYRVTEFKPNSIFTLSRKDNSYHLSYKLTAIKPDKTKLVYYEWTDDGNLDTQFYYEPLQKLKRLLEESL